MTTGAFGRILSLLKEDRLRPSTQGSRGILIASESDKGRVINSAAFRRLQQKAQVFPLDPNAAVRTRLTHSIEVSQVGRHLAQKIIEKHEEGGGAYPMLAAFVNTVETACLLHDLGNPPFGHLGEAAIRKWFLKERPAIEDLLNFDGNPQGFRIMSFLSGADDFGFNLTCTLLLSTVKYPATPNTRAAGRKIGLFSSDFQTYVRACEQVGWTAGRKFPFVRLMDTADDIAYSMSDLEDGLEKKIVRIEDIKAKIGPHHFAGAGPVDPFIAFKTSVINKAVETAAENFSKNVEAIIEGEEVKLLDSGSETGELILTLNDFARKHIYSADAAEQVELAGRSVIGGLLSHFGQLMNLDKNDFESLLAEDGKVVKAKDFDFEIRLLRRLPLAYRRKYSVERLGDEITRRAHLIVDFIAGMTDDFALHTYQILEGIRIK